MPGKKKSFPDLNNDGKVTQADVLKGRGAEGFMRGGTVKMMRGGPVKMMRGGSVKGYKDGGCVMGNRGVRDTKMV